MTPTWKSCIKHFETYLRVEKNLSPKTRNAYIYDLERFESYTRDARNIEESFPVDSVSTGDIKAYIHYLREEREYRATTLARTISSLRVFFDYCLDEKTIEENPTLDIENPRKTKKLPVYLAESELQKLFQAPAISTPLGCRDRAILVTMAFCGLRLQELVGLNIIDLDFEGGTVRVMGKGSKERMIPMNPDVESLNVAISGSLAMYSFYRGEAP